MIKNDRWIAQMAKDHGMITPFEDHQVRKGAISYGLSSYGYDIRIADEFMIFTNINTTIVDPKAFDPQSFVQFKGSVCTIPPNSFVLGRSIEYFKIPRDVLVVCVGKCLAGETRVVEASSGRLVRLEEFVRGGRQTIVNWNSGHSRNDEVAHHWSTGLKPVYRLVTRTGREIEGTWSHPVRVFSGWKAIGRLRPGDRIAVPRRLACFGRGPLDVAQATLLGLMLSDGSCRTPGSSPLYTSGDAVLHAALDRAARVLGYYTKPDARMGRRITSQPHRGGHMRPNGFYRWLNSMGLAVTSRFKFVPPCVFEAPKSVVAQFVRSLFSGDGSAYRSGNGVHIEYGTISHQLARDVHHLLLRFGVVSFLDAKESADGYKSYRITITSKEEILRFAKEIGFIEGSRKARALEDIVSDIQSSPQQKSNYDTLPKEAWGRMVEACRRNGWSARQCGFHPDQRQSVPRGLVLDVAERLSDAELGELATNDMLWDTVEKIEFTGVKPVYDLTLRGQPNFVANDMIVHNSSYARCGIITNVTPFEPEWEGHATLEVSNTTPLPARIYAFEGIAQALFFQSDEPCAISYADRKGKYQAQQGITLPKV